MSPTRKTRICLEQRLSKVLSCRKISKFRILANSFWRALARCPPASQLAKALWSFWLCPEERPRKAEGLAGA